MCKRYTVRVFYPDSPTMVDQFDSLEKALGFYNSCKLTGMYGASNKIVLEETTIVKLWEKPIDK